MSVFISVKRSKLFSSTLAFSYRFDLSTLKRSKTMLRFGLEPMACDAFYVTVFRQKSLTVTGNGSDVNTVSLKCCITTLKSRRKQNTTYLFNHGHPRIISKQSTWNINCKVCVSRWFGGYFKAYLDRTTSIDYSTIYSNRLPAKITQYDICNFQKFHFHWTLITYSF